MGRISLRGIGSVAETRAYLVHPLHGGPGVEGDTAVDEFYFIDFDADIFEIGKIGALASFRNPMTRC
jgi:hypothetical protein